MLDCEQNAAGSVTPMADVGASTARQARICPPLRATGAGPVDARLIRDVRRITSSGRRPVVQRVLDLVRLRNIEPAFSGRLDVTSVDPATLRMTWSLGADACELEVDLRSGRAAIARRNGGIEDRFLA